MRDARYEHASLPFFRGALRQLVALVLVATALLCAAAPAAAAQTVRPWLQWRSVETPHFVFHFPEQYREWTLALAARMEGVRDQVGRVVGYLPPRRVHIVVDDPTNDANGAAFTTLDAPTIVLYPTPPDPREEVGNFRVWGELVATHEFAHVAHLDRPSRNRLQQLYWSLSPVPLGPIPVAAPRWALEGYATYVEGRVTGSGRPNHAWRAAVLRQFALEGRLPGYAQLSATGPFETGNFAYLAGSAFFEWLARRGGDSSVTALWRRMTAKTVRSFDAAFTGVYGDAPATLYVRFVAEVTADALAFERTLARDALVRGTLVQRLERNTGDPAISPDGRFVALTIRHRTLPSELVVWSTADAPDTLAEARRAAQRERDPEDVPDRAFYPPPRHTIISLVAGDGYPYESPRWMPDNRHLLVTRRMPLHDGTIRPDLFIWSAEDGNLRRITTGASIRDADPLRDGRSAAAVRCDHGWCDLVRVDLASGAVQVLAAGSVLRNYYRPRVSKTTGEIVVAEQSGDRWRIVRMAPDGTGARYADPDDGVTRYDATFAVDGTTIVTTSEAGGVANLERLDPDDARATRLTAVTGAAVGADVAPDGALWFLSLEANGYDLRRLHPDSASIARAANASVPMRLGLVDPASPILPPRIVLATGDTSRRPSLASLGADHPYGIGPSRYRYVPAGTTGFGGSSLLLGVVRSDPVGRFGVAGLAAMGAGSLPAGVALTVTSRATRTERTLALWSSHEGPSARYAPAYGAGLDLTRSGGALRLQRTRVIDGGQVDGTLAALGERQHSEAFASRTREAVVGGFTIVGRQRDEAIRYQEQLTNVAEVGRIDGTSYHRLRSAFFFGAGSGTGALTTLRLAYGSMGGADGSERERFAIGGFASPLIDPLFDSRRVDAPAYPVGSSTANTFSSFRVGVPLPPLELFYAGASPDLYRTSLRSYGVEFRERVPAVPALGTPDVDVLAGFARALDAPVTKEWRYYVSLSIRP
ncbi:MAG: hypothetical protein ABJA80_04305 [bacterium]